MRAIHLPLMTYESGQDPRNQTISVGRRSKKYRLPAKAHNIPTGLSDSNVDPALMIRCKLRFSSIQPPFHPSINSLDVPQLDFLFSDSIPQQERRNLSQNTRSEVRASEQRFRQNVKTAPKHKVQGCENDCLGENIIPGSVTPASEAKTSRCYAPGALWLERGFLSSGLARDII